MVDKSPILESMTAQERIALMGRLWDSLDAAVVAPISPGLEAELTRREAAADEDPEGGVPWHTLRDELRNRLP
jgi:putative addiction module component (TIGR02574 family)